MLSNRVRIRGQQIKGQNDMKRFTITIAAAVLTLGLAGCDESEQKAENKSQRLQAFPLTHSKKSKHGRLAMRY